MWVRTLYAIHPPVEAKFLARHEPFHNLPFTLASQPGGVIVVIAYQDPFHVGICSGCIGHVTPSGELDLASVHDHGILDCCARRWKRWLFPLARLHRGLEARRSHRYTLPMCATADDSLEGIVAAATIPDTARRKETASGSCPEIPQGRALLTCLHFIWRKLLPHS